MVSCNDLKGLKTALRLEAIAIRLEAVAIGLDVPKCGSLKIYMFLMESGRPSSPQVGSAPPGQRKCRPLWSETSTATGRIWTILDVHKKLLGAKGITTRSKDATRGSWHRY